MGGFEEQSDQATLVGRLIAGKLELQKLLGTGAMGQVYRAHHRNLNKRIAIKVMRSEQKPSDKQIARFRAEAQSASQIEHRNTVDILDFGEDGDDNLLYIAMEFLDGEELTSLMRREKQIPEDRACRIMMQVCAALAAAHDQGVVHRDIKPGNVMLVTAIGDDGPIPEFVKVCDFGIAKLLSGSGDVEPLTMTGVSLGTPAYASPEQIMGEDLDGRSDIYSCGVVLFTMLTGRRPFVADSAVAIAMQHISQEPPKLEKFRPNVSPGLAAIVQRAISKKPEDRFKDGREMRNALRAFAGSGAYSQEFSSMPPSGPGSLATPRPAAGSPGPTTAPPPVQAPPPPPFAVPVDPPPPVAKPVDPPPPVAKPVDPPPPVAKPVDPPPPVAKPVDPPPPVAKPVDPPTPAAKPVVPSPSASSEAAPTPAPEPTTSDESPPPSDNAAKPDPSAKAADAFDLNRELSNSVELPSRDQLEGVKKKSSGITLTIVIVAILVAVGTFLVFTQAANQ